LFKALWGPAVARMKLHPNTVGDIAPAVMREALEAYAEERSIEREWQAHLIAAIINTCKSGKLGGGGRGSKKRLDANDLLFKADRVRAAKRYRAAVAAERKRAEESGVTMWASPDWGPI
jgi:hypothetical protein